jgi:hypothetical protein
MVVGLLLSAIGFGVVFAWTRSLIPCMVAHAVFDIPMTTFWQSVLLAGLVIGAVVVWRRAVARVFKQVLLPGSGLYMAAVAIGMLLLAVVLEARDRMGDRATSRLAATGIRA